jgi:acylphosphatase
MDGDATRRRVVAHGRVQGVTFRDSTLRRALLEGVAGSVRNRPDGTVEAAFEGPPAAVDRMVAFARIGPPGARVDRLEVTDEEPRGESGFRVAPDARPAGHWPWPARGSRA